MTGRDALKAYGAWAAVCFFWGTTYLAIRIGVAALPPALFAGVRFLIAGSVLTPVLLWRGHKLPSKRDFAHIAVVGVALLAVANGSVVWAEQWVPSGLAALIVAMIPFFMTGFEAWLPQGDKLNLKKVTGIALGFAGLFLLVSPEIHGSMDRSYLFGIFAIVLATLSWSLGSLYSKYRTVKTSPFMAAALQMLIGGLILVVFGGIKGEFSRFSYDPAGFAAMGYLVVFGSIVGYGSYIYALSKLPAGFVSTYAYLNPVIAVLLGWLVLDERLDWRILTAAVTILSGVFLVKSGHGPRIRRNRAPARDTAPLPALDEGTA